MKPILLTGHERSLTKILYNKEGDLLFSASKDHFPNVWWSINGERVGTYKGHAGAIWDIAVTMDSTKMVSASADQSCFVWDTEKGVFVFNLFSNRYCLAFAEPWSHSVCQLHFTKNINIKAFPRYFLGFARIKITFL